jgi:hypothetical protein
MKNETGILRNFTDGDRAPAGDSVCVHAQRLEAPPHSELVLHVDHVCHA